MKISSLSFIPKYFFSKVSEFSNVLSKFKQNISLHEHEATSMQIHPDLLRSIPDSDIALNKLAAGFLAKTDHLKMFCSSNENLPDANISTPSSSFVKIHLPLEESKELRKLFIRFVPEKVRVGRILEALDFISNYVAYFHCKTEPMKKKCTLMTVCVDHLKFFRNIRADKNIVINAYPTYTGASTVEIRTDLFQNQPNGELAMASSALFLLAARDFNDYSKPYEVPKLIIDKEKEKEKAALRYELGKINQKQRKSMRSGSLFKTPPSQEETLEIHEIFQSLQEKIKNKISVSRMKDTIKTKSLLMYNQDKNINGKIFGGHLMKESIEFAWVIAYIYANGNHPEFEAIDDFQFINSVEVGSVVDFEAQISLAEGSLIHVQVIATKYPRVIVEGQKEREVCTELNITFKCANCILPPVYSTTYEDAMKYLEAKRRVSRQMNLNSF